jgi:hypothetical protein
MEPLLAEQYAFALENSEPSNYTMRPNVIDHLTYDEIDEKTGEKIVKRLSVFACHLYTVMRSIAGNENVCWRNTENLAEIANMSEGAVIKCKKELQQKFHQLDGNPLISITEHKKVKEVKGKKIGYIYHKTLIKNIWNYNRAFFFLKKNKVSTDSPHEPDGGSDSPHEPDSRRSDSPGERTNTSCSNTPLYKEQHSTAEAVSVCSSDPVDSVVSSQTRMFNWLMQMGCDILGASTITQNFSQQELSLASGYVQKMIPKMKEKNKPITNIIGYLRKTLEGRWWEKNVS